jgi:Mn2+/Fe2+ NRAMP family transporter
MLFLAALGVAWQGAQLGNNNPAASVFENAAGWIGYKFFGVVMWAAAITSVVGASYTSVSFIKTFYRSLERNLRWLTTGFILLSLVVFLFLKQAPGSILVMAGALNGLILPVSLAIMLLAITKKQIVSSYQHPLWLQAAGWAVVAIMGWMGGNLIWDSFYTGANN